jgi:hypothetical protein
VRWAPGGNATQSRIDVVNGGIGDGIIAAYDGQGEGILETEGNGRPMVRGLHSLKPVPMDEGRVSAGALELRWVLPSDLNGDCVVNDLDLAILEAHWLECNALDCNDVDL